MLLVRNKYLATAALVVLLSASYCPTAEPNLQSDLDEVLVQEGLTGVVWSLVSESGKVSLGATGLRDNLLQSEFTIDTRFHVGSVTKSLVATGVLQMVSEGLIELDAPVSRYLPDLSFEKILDIAFRGNYIGTMDHPALRKLRGEI